MHQTLADGIKDRDRCPNCNGKGKVIVVIERETKMMECIMCLGSGDIKGVKSETD